MFETTLDINSARVTANAIVSNLSEMLNVNIKYEGLGDDTIYSPVYGCLTVEDTDEIADDTDARFVFQYIADKFTALVIPSDNKVELITEDGFAINPLDGSTFEADCPQDGAFELSKWKNFDASIIN